MSRRADWSLPRIITNDQIDRHYDLVIFVPFTLWELPLLEQLSGLRSKADRIAVYFPEAWWVDALDPRVPYEPWHMVDDIFVAIQPSVEILAKALDRTVHYLPMAADVHAFRPRSLDEPRPIDVLNLGRRIPDLHEALLEWAYRTNHFYRYDTFSVARMDDPIRHRLDLGQLYQRSSIALCSYPKHDQPEVTQNRRIIPQRVWECLASGAVMIGMPPEEELQRTAVGEVVVQELPDDPAQGVVAIEKLLDGDNTNVRRRNLQLALRRHDWVHRWRSLLVTAGFEPPEQVEERIAGLSSIAESMG